MTRLPHVSPRWTWVSLISLLAGACKPPALECDPVSYFQVLEPQEGAGAAPFSIERQGPAVTRYSVEKVPGILELRRNNRVRVSWRQAYFGEFSDLIFSPSEGLARNPKNPEEVYPMRRYSDGKSERVRFGFRAPPCRPRLPYAVCTQVGDPLFLAAEMTCQPQPESRASR